ncbi:ABC transporter ATP-binding protein [Zavarzinia compransoris]|uniref:ABC transporter ATP-binding protein n=1 Tax=Zavarzinia compransoris TaxID=1264899 RepID=A0A317EDS6_9PROT|nr:ABC transporter ATP-binding protein [Zavarzinia compransoris]PWR23503.1 ABC transporter ATP-binding protein [Zavarzinia compransoris]TDP47714.1 amino acid/amide ABC transporter ATP-binding protein 2 (HAAT family) [Zavarzinia compransoris]
MADAARTIQPAAAGAPRLKISGLNAYYGESHVLHGVDIEVKRGEVVALLGRNGAGKTSTLRSIMGLVGRRTGSIVFDGAEIVNQAPHRIARLGVGYVPEERGIFASLNVQENLLLPPVIKPGGMSVQDIFTLFPNLKERLYSPGTKLSGGEQQMLAIARILRTGSDFILLDEPTEGLAPVIVQQIGEAVRRLKAGGLTMILVEQSIHFVSTIADRFYVMEDGHVVDSLTAAELAADKDRLVTYLGV